jgi:hypothetical protein
MQSRDKEMQTNKDTPISLHPAIAASVVTSRNSPGY